MEKLIATKPIYYKGKNYVPGEEIPESDAEMVEAWKRAGSVKELPGLENASLKAILKETVERFEEEQAEAAAEKPAEESVKETMKKGKRKNDI